jgi:hypothetical protein
MKARPRGPSPRQADGSGMLPYHAPLISADALIPSCCSAYRPLLTDLTDRPRAGSVLLTRVQSSRKSDDALSQSPQPPDRQRLPKVTSWRTECRLWNNTGDTRNLALKEGLRG